MSEELKVLKSISFSGLTQYTKCGHYFFLNHIKGLYVFDDTIWTHYGTLLHKYVQAVLISEPVGVGASKPWRSVTLEPLDPKIAAKTFIKTWWRFCNLYKKQLAKQYNGDPKKLVAGPVRAIMGVRDLLKKEFGDYRILSVEEKFKEETKYPQLFSGQIDVVFEAEDGRIVIVDIKTCPNHFMFLKYKKKDKHRDYQLTLYKHFLAKKNGYNLDNMETYFLTVAKQDIRPSAQLMRITSGKKKTQNALAWLHGILSAVQRNMYVKNRMSCDAFYGKSCPFKGTTHCP